MLAMPDSADVAAVISIRSGRVNPGPAEVFPGHRTGGSDLARHEQRPCSVLSDTCQLANLLEPCYTVLDQDHNCLDLSNGWVDRWTATVKVAGTKLSF
jgi:hypothetical protein